MTETLSFAKQKITLEAKVLDKMPMTLYSQAGEGQDGERKVKVNLPVTNNCVYVVIEGGQTYQVNFIDVVQACLKAEKKAATSTALTKSDLEPVATELAEQLKRYVIERYPHYESTMKVQTIAKQVQLLHRQDERFTYELIGKVMRYLFETYQPRGNFDWREQVRSGVKFRKHFPALLDLIRKELGDQQIETIG